MPLTELSEWLGFLILAIPASLFLGLVVLVWVQPPNLESVVARSTTFLTWSGFLIACSIPLIMLASGMRMWVVHLGDWYGIAGSHFRFRIELIFDWLSIPFVILAYLLCATIASFAAKYLHRESGYGRFFLLYALFLNGVVIATLAGTIELLFAGWELVGLSSALLVAFFHERKSPVRNGLRVWSLYRISDAAFLIAAVAMHHVRGEGDLARLLRWSSQSDTYMPLSHGTLLFVGILLLIAAMGKSGLIPFCGWLPRAMEGPTPSSAIFYGALSVHLGAFLLLRVHPIVEQSLMVSAATVVIGFLTAVTAALSARVQSDIKTVLALSSLSQVGLIVAEIGLGFQIIALIHMIGHACFRTLQMLRSPSLLADYHRLENAIGKRLSNQERKWVVGTSMVQVERVFYRWSLETFSLDAWLDALFVRPWVVLFRSLDKLERRWHDLLNGGSAHAPLDYSHRVTEWEDK